MSSVSSINPASVLDSFQSYQATPSVEFPASTVAWAIDASSSTFLALAENGSGTDYPSGAVLYDLSNGPALSSGQAIGYLWAIFSKSVWNASSESINTLTNSNTAVTETCYWHQVGGLVIAPNLAPPGRTPGVSCDWRTDIDYLSLQMNGVRAVGAVGAIFRYTELAIGVAIYNRPTLTVTGPASPVTTTSRPTITWSFAGDTLGQSYFWVKVFTQAQYEAGGFNPQTDIGVADTGWVNSSSPSYTLPSNLVNGTTYRAYVMAAQTLPTSGFRHSTVDGTTLAALGSTQYKQFTISLAAPPVPTGVQPAASSTVTTDIPTLRATLGASSVSGALVRAEWQLATDAGFTANVRTVTMDIANQVASGAVSKACEAGVSELFQGTWYVRCRELDSLGQYGSYSSGQSFTVAHPPSATPQSPVSQASRVSGDISFAFTFSDTSPTDYQTAFQIIIERDSDSVQLYDSGKQSSAATAYAINVSDTYNDVLLRWKVRAYDSDDVAGAYSSNAQFYPRAAPTIVPGLPADPVTQPLPTYDFTLSGGRTITQYRFTTYLQGSLTIVDDSGWVTGATGSYAVTTQLTNDVDYTVVMQVVDQYGLDGSTSVDFSAAWEPPDSPEPTLDTTLFDTTGRVRVTWDENRDAQFVAYRIYYRRSSDAVFELKGETTDTDDDPYVFDFYDAAANVEGIVVVTQLANRYGDPTESSTGTNQVTFTPASSHYFLIAADTALTVRLSRVNADSFTENYEQGTVELIGRGRRVEKGTRFGFSGSLSGRIYDDGDTGLTAAQTRTALTLLRAGESAIKLRNPFGDVWLVALGDIQYERVPGVGTNEYFDFTVEYWEVVAP